MSFNLVDFVKGSLGNEMAQHLAGSLGQDPKAVSGALDSAIPTILGAVLGKGSDEKGAGELLDFVGKQDFDGLLSGNVGNLLSGGAQTNNILNSGTGILKFLLGSDSKITSLLNLFGKSSGLGGQAGGGMMKMIAPFIMSSIASYAKSKALNATGLASLFGSQRDNITKAAPAALLSELGFAAGSKSSGGKLVSPKPASSSSGGFGLGKLLPLALLLGLLWFAAKFLGGSSDVTVASERIGQAANSGVGAVGDIAGEAVGVVDGAAGKVGEMANSAGEMVADVAIDAKGAAEGLVANAGEGIAEMVDDASQALSSFKLPDGKSIDAPEGSFTQRLVEHLGSGETSEAKSFDFDRVNFQTGSANLTADSARQVNNLAAVLQAYPNIKIAVEGHTDNTGNPVANKKLSQQRAEQVRGTLISQGIVGGRVAAMGYGQEKPIADNGTEPGRAENRRVSVMVIGN